MFNILFMQGLTQVEEMLISSVMPIMSVYRLPLGQYGYTGHVINLPQDVVSFLRLLPRVPTELDVLVVRKDNEHSHRDFRVCRSVVQDALTYLIENNKYFRANDICLNEKALQDLPDDGNLMTVRSLELPEDDQPMNQSYIDKYEAHLATSFVPNATQQKTEQETIKESLQNLQSKSSHTLTWPTIGGSLSMSLLQKDTSVWPSQPCFLQERLTFLGYGATKSPLATISHTYTQV